MRARVLSVIAATLLLGAVVTVPASANHANILCNYSENQWFTDNQFCEPRTSSPLDQLVLLRLQR